MTPKLIVFDLAGTTVDGSDQVPFSLQRALADHHVNVPFADANALMGTPKPFAIRQLLVKHAADNQTITDELIDHIHNRFVDLMVDYYQNSPEVKEKPGVSEFFRTLKTHHIKVAVDTGFDRQITDVILKRMRWQERQLMDASVTSDEVPRGRPHPDMIFRAMQLTGIKDIATVAKVGDTVSDMRQGQAAGCAWVVGVTTGACTEAELQQEPHTHLIGQVAELAAIFGLPEKTVLENSI